MHEFSVHDYCFKTNTLSKLIYFLDNREIVELLITPDDFKYIWFSFFV